MGNRHARDRGVRLEDVPNEDAELVDWKVMLQSPPPAAPKPAPPRPPTHDEKVAQLQKQVDEVKGIALGAIEKVLERQERLEDVEERAEDIRYMSESMVEGSKKLSTKKKWEYRKWACLCWIMCCILVVFLLGGSGALSWFMGWI
jgi:chromosome segregation ATPase